MFLGTGSSLFGVESRVKGFDLTYGSGQRFVSFRGRFPCEGFNLTYVSGHRFVSQAPSPQKNTPARTRVTPARVSRSATNVHSVCALSFWERLGTLWLAQELDWDTPRPFVTPVNRKSSDLPRNPCLQSLSLFKRSGAEV